MPASAWASGGMPRWVMVDGLQIRVAKPPSDEARVMSLERREEALGRRRAAAQAEGDHEAGAGLLPRASAQSGWLSRPG